MTNPEARIYCNSTRHEGVQSTYFDYIKSASNDSFCTFFVHLASFDQRYNLPVLLQATVGHEAAGMC